MVNEADLNIIVSNVLSENPHKHCRLCLGDIANGLRVRFKDLVASHDDHQQKFMPLSSLLKNVLGEEVCEEIPGIDAVCEKCVEKLVDCNKFIENCKKSTSKLHKIFDNVSEALKVDVEYTVDQRLYVIVGENESKVILMDKEKDIVSEKALSVHKSKEESIQKSQTKQLQKDGEIFKCAQCKEHRRSKESLEEHYQRTHTVYLCKECGIPCTGLDKLRTHEEKHIENTSKCPKCEKVYLTKVSYIKHVQLCLADKLDPHPFRAKYVKQYSCEKCGKGYSTPGGLRVHERFEHENAKPHVCEYCGKKFTAPSYLKIHLVKHTGEKNFKCNRCSNNFVSKEALLYHTRRHTGEKPFSCHMCSERFVNASARAEHIKFKHTGPTLPCDICKRKFFTSSFLKQHIKRHHDPSSKLYTGRSLIPPNLPGDQNLRMKMEDD